MMSMLNLFWIVPIVASVAWVFGYKADHERVKAFIKRHIVDDDLYQDEGHSATRCAKDDYIDWSKVPKGFDWVAIDPPNGACPNVVWAYYDINGPKFTNAGWRAPENTTFTPPREICSSAIIGPLPPWRESLRKRPV